MWYKPFFLFMNDKCICFSCVFLFLFSFSVKADLSPRQNFEESFATTMMLTDNESVTLGFANFDPDALLDPDTLVNFDNSTIIDRDASHTRNQLSVYSLPYTYSFSDDPLADSITTQFSYVKQVDDFNLFSESATFNLDSSKDEIFSLSVFYNKKHQMHKRLTFEYGLASALMYYKNTFNNQTVEASIFEQYFDHQYFNVTSNALLLQPKIKLIYSKDKSWGKWNAYSDLIAFSGFTFNNPSSVETGYPSGWRINTGGKIFYTLNKGVLHAESLFVKLQRSDMGGDMVNSFGTRHFYEFGLGLLLDTTKFSAFSDNLGIGININKGSALTGGSIVFYFNEM